MYQFVFKQVIDQRFHLFGLLIRGVRVLEQVFFTVILLVFNQPQIADDRRQRRAQIMTDIRNQLVLTLFNLALIVHRLNRAIDEGVHTGDNVLLIPLQIKRDPMIKVALSNVMELGDDVVQLILMIASTKISISNMKAIIHR